MDVSYSPPCFLACLTVMQTLIDRLYQSSFPFLDIHKIWREPFLAGKIHKSRKSLNKKSKSDFVEWKIFELVRFFPWNISLGELGFLYPPLLSCNKEDI